MPRTVTIPDDVADIITQVRHITGHPSDVTTLWAIVRMAGPGLIDHLKQYRGGTGVVPGKYQGGTTPVPLPQGVIKNAAIQALFED
jgi:hypothetical protein